MSLMPLFEHPSQVVVPSYTLNNSMYLDSGQYIQTDHSVAASERDFTYATWIKINPGSLPSFGTLFAAALTSNPAANRENLWYSSQYDDLWNYSRIGGSTKMFHQYSTDFNTFDGWMHVCAQKDTASLTYTVEISSIVSGFAVVNAFVTDHQGFMGEANRHRIGQSVYGNYPLYARLADTHIIMGANYDSSYFINGDLTPKAFTEDHGTNGAHFLYENASNLGENEVGTNWTDHGSPAQSTDVPS